VEGARSDKGSREIARSVRFLAHLMPIHRQRCYPYFRGRAFDQYNVNVVSSAFRNHSATSFAWKGRSHGSRSRLSKSVISSAVLGFLILFNARNMCSLRRRLEFSTFFIGTERILWEPLLRAV